MTTTRTTIQENAPSETRQDEPFLPRLLGFLGLAGVALGIVIVIANNKLGPRWIPASRGYVLIVIGTVMMLFHAFRESEIQLRRAYGFLGYALLLTPIVTAFIPSVGWQIGIAFLAPGLLLIAIFARNEEDSFWRSIPLYTIGGVGVASTLIGVGGGLYKPDFLAGVGILLAMIGLLTLWAFVSLLGPTASLGRYISLAVGVIGVAIILYALARSILPVLAHDWRVNPSRIYRQVNTVGAIVLVLGLVGIGAYLGALKKKIDAETGRLVRLIATALTAIGAIILVVGVSRTVAPGMLRSSGWGAELPAPYLVPGGLLLIFAGLCYLLSAIGLTSEHPLVVLVRRELSSIFYSPIAYLVLFGWTILGAIHYFVFIVQIDSMSAGGNPPEEPVLLFYGLAFLPVFCVMFGTPLLTMRLMSEEKRTGSLEVLLTAPLSEWPIVLSKFLAVLGFYMLLWVPWGLLLVALRIEAERPFDFRPLFSGAVIIFATGAAYLAMGLFCSTLTRNQIVAAVMAFMGMMVIMSVWLIGRIPSIDGWYTPIFKQLSFIDLLQESLTGRLWLRDVVVHLSIALFWLFLSVKVLEARKWA
jgi:ABC-type transport system involved in multi-copper enzyme maturation permease subunit